MTTVHDSTLADNSRLERMAATSLGDWRRGRGARSNASGRYETLARELFDDGWRSLEEMPALRTEVTVETARSVITSNSSPDLNFDRSINAYRGCEHGCSYCYARPSHARMGLSPGLDFESKLFAKTNVAEVLRKELLKKGYEPRTIALGTNTDPYQPIERRYRLTRQVLEVLSEFGHPVGIVTKSALIERDIDILAPMAAKGLVKVAISVTTLDPKLARSMEPRASTPALRLKAIAALAAAGIPTAVLAAPIIPGLNDAEIEAILAAARQAGASEAGYVMLRLPQEIKELFRQWLLTDQPGRAKRVISLVQSLHGGKDYDATFGVRQKGSGPIAWTTGRRFELACRRFKLNQRKLKLTSEHFRKPPQPGDQLTLL